MSAIESWKNRVKTHHDQSIGAQRASSWLSGDFWRPIASYFRSDPYRTDDPVLDRLVREVASNKSVLDVGGVQEGLLCPWRCTVAR